VRVIFANAGDFTSQRGCNAFFRVKTRIMLRIGDGLLEIGFLANIWDFRHVGAVHKGLSFDSDGIRFNNWSSRVRRRLDGIAGFGAKTDAENDGRRTKSSN
jgi:hypothetical protein